MSANNLTQICLRRLHSEYNYLNKSPVENIKIHISTHNILEWYFCIYGLNDSRYIDGEYYGLIKMDADYPLKPPKYYMYTPNGRFHINEEICTSNSDYHPLNWQPTWTMDALFRGFLSLFLEDNSVGQIHYNHIRTTNAEKKHLALLSRQYNYKHNKILHDVFSVNMNVICIENLKQNQQDVLTTKKQKQYDTRTDQQDQQDQQDHQDHQDQQDQQCSENNKHLLDIKEIQDQKYTKNDKNVLDNKEKKNTECTNVSNIKQEQKQEYTKNNKIVLGVKEKQNQEDSKNNKNVSEILGEQKQKQEKTTQKIKIKLKE